MSTARIKLLKTREDLFPRAERKKKINRIPIQRRELLKITNLHMDCLLPAVPKRRGGLRWRAHACD
jgi:hypothetical protein